MARARSCCRISASPDASKRRTVVGARPVSPVAAIRECLIFGRTLMEGPAMQDMNESRRRSLRLRDYDYAQEGAYFVTVCTHQRACVLGTIADEQMQLSPLGDLVAERWEDLPNH